MLAHGEAEEGSAETTGVTRLCNEKRMVCMRRDMVTPAHYLPTDDGSDCVGAAWRSRFDKVETQDDIHRRLSRQKGNLICQKNTDYLKTRNQTPRL